MARYIEAPDTHDDTLPAVFLAGGITGCPDWQAQARRMLDPLPVAILNPRRADFPIHDPSAAAGQVAWEFEHLRRADVVLFYFPDSGPVVQPIALYELGSHAAAGKPIVVGADPGYVRRADVVLQLGHIRPDVQVRDDLAAVCADVRTALADREQHRPSTPITGTGYVITSGPGYALPGGPFQPAPAPGADLHEALQHLRATSHRERY
jgi:hypothetical protein